MENCNREWRTSWRAATALGLFSSALPSTSSKGATPAGISIPGSVTMRSGRSAG